MHDGFFVTFIFSLLDDSIVIANMVTGAQSLTTRELRYWVCKNMLALERRLAESDRKPLRMIIRAIVGTYNRGMQILALAHAKVLNDLRSAHKKELEEMKSVHEAELRDLRQMYELHTKDLECIV